MAYTSITPQTSQLIPRAESPQSPAWASLTNIRSKSSLVTVKCSCGKIIGPTQTGTPRKLGTFSKCCISPVQAVLKQNTRFSICFGCEIQFGPLCLYCIILLFDARRELERNSLRMLGSVAFHSCWVNCHIIQPERY